MMDGLLSGLTGVASDIFNFIISSFMGVIAIVLDGIFSVVGLNDLPIFSDFSSYLISFWDLVFQFVGYIRSALLIDAFSMQLIYSCLFIRLTYKPVISLIKMFVGWFNKLKL